MLCRRPLLLASAVAAFGFVSVADAGNLKGTDAEDGRRKGKKSAAAQEDLQLFEGSSLFKHGERELRNCPGKATFEFHLGTDNYGFESSWALLQIDSVTKAPILGLVAGPPPNHRYPDATLLKGSMCLDPGTYVLEIFDAAKDGVCCGFGDGSYAAFINGVQFLASDPDGEEFSLEREEFDATIPTLPPTSSPIVTPPTQITLRVENLSNQQPFSPFFVMVHNDQAVPLFKMGEPPNSMLATLAELGNPNPFVNYYTNTNTTGVFSAETQGGVTQGGNTLEIKVTVSNEFNLVTIASMCENTNDCFVALNGVELMPGMILEEPGLDAGSEDNDESCASVPGPACLGEGRFASPRGEGFVQVHPGITGDGDLPADIYNWADPLMRVTVDESV